MTRPFASAADLDPNEEAHEPPVTAVLVGDRPTRLRKHPNNPTEVAAALPTAVER